MPRTPSVSAEELLARFESLGGQVFHYQGRRKCLVSTMPIGRHRVRHDHPLNRPRWILPTDLTDPFFERTSKVAMGRANRVLL
jgi:hypothetical protein